jgi:CRISPR system Cascade subunit CasB
LQKQKVEQNGTVKIGQAIARCYEEGNQSDQAKAKLRRLLACDTTEEVCRILRSLFSLISSKSGAVLTTSHCLMICATTTNTANE